MPNAGLRYEYIFEIHTRVRKQDSTSQRYIGKIYRIIRVPVKQVSSKLLCKGFEVTNKEMISHERTGKCHQFHLYTTPLQFLPYIYGCKHRNCGSHAVAGYKYTRDRL